MIPTGSKNPATDVALRAARARVARAARWGTPEAVAEARAAYQALRALRDLGKVSVPLSTEDLARLRAALAAIPETRVEVQP